MAIDIGPFRKEINKIVAEGQSTVHYKWEAFVLANGKKQYPLKMLSMDLIRNYKDNYGDEIHVDLVFGQGTFEHEIFPYRKDLKVYLTRTPIFEREVKQNPAERRTVQCFQAFLTDEVAEQLKQNVKYLKNEHLGNLANIIIIRFNLVDKALEQIRMKTIGGVFRHENTATTVKYLLTKISKDIDVDVEHKIIGVEMLDEFDKEPQNQIVIPHGTRFTTVSEYIHEQSSGLYNTGLGFYLQGNTRKEPDNTLKTGTWWFVYPLYDITLFDRAKRTLTILNIPPSELPGLTRTWRKTQNQLIIVSTGEVVHKDKTETAMVNEGNGARYNDARRMMDDFAYVENNIATALRKENASEYIAEKRKNGLENIQHSGVVQTSNMLLEYGKMSVRKGCFIQVTWENSKPDELIPGMPLKFMYNQQRDKKKGGDIVREVKGILIGAHHYTALDKPGFTGERFISRSMLTLFVDRKILVEDDA